jgi:hypothetical protein
MISEYGGKEKYASKAEQQKHEAKETAKKETTEQPTKKVVLGKKKEEPKNSEGRTAAQEKEYMDEVRAQMQREKENKEKDDNTPVGLARRAKIAENKGDKKEAGRLYDAAKRAGLVTKGM